MAKKNGGVKEFFRKRIVALKRKPQMVALVALAIAFVYFSFNLTHVSNTTANINYPGMGLSAFVIMLFSVLSMVCFLNAFPRRKKVNLPMLVLMFAMIVGVLGCSFYYEGLIAEKITNTRQQFLVAAQDNVRNAKIGAEESVKSVSAAKASLKEVEKLAGEVEAVQAAIDEALTVTTAQQSVRDAAVKNAKAAVTNAQKAVTSAQKAVDTATASSEEAKLKAETSLVAENLAAVNSTARSAISAATKAANNATTAAKAVETAKAELAKAENALATVDVWAAVEKLQAEIEQLKKGTQEAASGSATSSSTASAAKAEQEAIELAQAIVDEALAQGEVKVDELLYNTENRKVTETRMEPTGEKNEDGTDVMAEKTVETTVQVKTPSSVSRARTMLQGHRIILLLAVLLTALLPVYAPLLRKIRTSIEVEANENMGEIELDSSDE